MIKGNIHVTWKELSLLLTIFMVMGCVSLPNKFHNTQASDDLISNSSQVVEKPVTEVKPVEQAPSQPAESARSDALLAKVSHLRWPIVGGRISSGFGRRRSDFHKGIDIVAPRGTPVYASAAGEVVYAARTHNGYGRMVVIKHPDENTVYAHLSKLLVKTGQMVAQSEKIGLVGATGRATGPHLHFEVRSSQDNEPMDPMLFLPHYDLISEVCR